MREVMGLGWGTTEKPIMDPAVLSVLTQNHADIEAIVAIIGWDNLWKIAPHAINIWKTIQSKGPSK